MPCPQCEIGAQIAQEFKFIFMTCVKRKNINRKYGNEKKLELKKHTGSLSNVTLRKQNCQEADALNLLKSMYTIRGPSILI